MTKLNKNNTIDWEDQDRAKQELIDLIKTVSLNLAFTYSEFIDDTSGFASMIGSQILKHKNPATSFFYEGNFGPTQLRVSFDRYDLSKTYGTLAMRTTNPESTSRVPLLTPENPKEVSNLGLIEVSSSIIFPQLSTDFQPDHAIPFGVDTSSLRRNIQFCAAEHLFGLEKHIHDLNTNSLYLPHYGPRGSQFSPLIIDGKEVRKPAYSQEYRQACRAIMEKFEQPIVQMNAMFARQIQVTELLS